MKPFLSLSFLLLQIAPFLTGHNLSHAGGPLVISGPDGNTPVTYQTSNITMNVENGDLGSLTNAAAITLLQDAFDLWNNVSTSTVNLNIDQTQIALDVNETNFETYIPTVDGTNLNDDDNLNPVVFDSDGKIIEAIFGIGQTGLLGIAGSFINDETGNYIEGFILINGANGGTDTKITLTLAHEVAHFIGLDHTQVGIDNEESFSGLPQTCLTTDAVNYPLMYPILCRFSNNLHADDISAISALYPATDLSDSFGILEGTFVNESGDAILGANIWVENTASGETISIISDYLKQGTGFYKLLLPAGAYTLHANSINTEFTAGSSVGPYATSSTDISFSDPHPITEITYFGSDEPNDEVLTITTNETFVINFSNTGALVKTKKSDDEDDSIADLFGSLSHLTLILLTLSTLLLRRFRKH